MQHRGNDYTEAEAIDRVLKLPQQLDAHLYLLSEDVFRFAHELSIQEWSIQGAEARAPLDARRHGKTTVLALPRPRHRGKYVMFYVFPLGETEPELSSSVVFIDLGGGTDGGLCRIGMITPGGQFRAAGNSKTAQSDIRLAATHTTICAFALSLINQPALISRRPALSRQVRRAMKVRGAGAHDQVHRVTWDLSREIVQRVSRDPSFQKMPLHWRRGHYRRAEQHWARAIQRPDAIRIEERDQWWQWIEGTWVGHPAFGTKLSVHAPRMSLGKLAGVE